ncbi:MAG: LamG-like jellyroll fold domain-containing protein [Candidatus Micrarchaeota archaeon]
MVIFKNAGTAIIILLVFLSFSIIGDLTVVDDAQSPKVTVASQNGLVGYWMLDEGAGTVAGDSSGNGNDGLVYNPVWTTGKFGNALQFDNTAYKRVYTPHTISLITKNAVTVSAWVQPAGPSGDHQVILAKWYDESSNFIGSYVLELQPTGVTPQFVVRRSGDLLVQTAVSSTNLVAGQWTHVTGTYDGATIKIYVNGALTGSVALAGVINLGSQPVMIGAHSYGSAIDQNIFNGKIDDVKLFNRTLSQEEISLEYSNGATCVSPTAGMVVSADTVLCPGTFILPYGIDIASSNIKLACFNTVLQRQSPSDPSSAIYIRPGLSNILVSGCEIRDFSSGIYANGTGIGQNKIRILNNSLTNVAQGVYLRNADNSEVGYNLIGGIYYGIGVYNDRYSTSSTNISIHDNSIVISSGPGSAIITEYTDASKIENNTIFGGDNGIYLFMSSNNHVYNNSVDYTRSGGTGINLKGTSDFNNIVNNSFRHNYYGIRADNIQFLPDPVFYISDYNNFTGNNVTDNTNGADIGTSLPGTVNNKAWYNNFERNSNWQASGFGLFNITINGKGRGNYWDDALNLCIYDTNGDGYGDAGTQYPYSNANGARASVFDWAPKTQKAPTCGDGCCWGETCSSCPGDCGACPVICGMYGCQAGETCSSCPSDCGSCGGYSGGGTRSCPYVHVWDGKEFVMDNDIMPAGNPNEVTDYYKLMKPLQEKDGKYLLKIVDSEDETSWMDKLSLIVVDHPAGTKIAPTPEGKILIYSEPVGPKAAVDASGKDVRELVSSVGNGDYYGKRGDSLVLEFEQAEAKDGARLIMRTDLKCPPLYSAKSLHISVMSNGEWVKIGVVHPHQLWDEWAVEIPAELLGAKTPRVKVEWTQDHKLDFIGLDVSKQKDVKVVELEPMKAVHSNKGDVLRELMTSDGRYAITKLDEEIALEFAYPGKASGERSFVFVSEGYYKPNLPPSQSEQMIRIGAYK